MPRPKPQEPLITRSVRLSDTQWAAFEALGGSNWLRSRIDKARMTGVAKRQRNNRIRQSHAAGCSLTEIAQAEGLDRTTVWRIVNGK